MRTEPEPALLIERICESLEKTALADMASPLAARQLKAGLWALRRIADSPDFSDTLLAREVADMEALLRLPSTSAATAEALRVRHVFLQERLIETDRWAQAAYAAGGAGAKETVHALRALYRRMLARERGEPEASAT